MLTAPATPVEIPIVPLAISRFEPVLPAAAYAEFQQTAVLGEALIDGRTVWSVSSTARGGGVAEMLIPLLGYVSGAGVRTRWLVLEGDEEFFTVTKRLHHRLHGRPGDGGPLGTAERAAYTRTLARNEPGILAVVAPGDVVLLHDPQTAGLAPALAGAGALVVWRMHIGSDAPSALADEAQDFLAGDLAAAHAYVVSRPQYAWRQMTPERVHVIAPSIDPLSAKNQALGGAQARSILQVAGLLEGPAENPGAATFLRDDGRTGVVTSGADLLQVAPAPAGAPVVAQISRWDPLKDPLGVMDGFTRCLRDGSDAHLVLAGPDVSAVTDDPEGAQVLAAVRDRWYALAAAERERVHIACLPLNDREENAATVNALQRTATVVVQKSLAEGFGLTVAEAMWKTRPVVAGRVGGIQDQIVDGVSGILLDDPTDLDAFARALGRLLDDPDAATAMGAAAHERVLEHFLEARHLRDWLQVVQAVLEG